MGKISLLLGLSLLLCILHVFLWMTRFQGEETKAVLCLFKLLVWALPSHAQLHAQLYPGKIILLCVFYKRLNWRSVFLLSVFVLFVHMGSDHIYQIGLLQVWDGASLPVPHLWAWVTSRLLDHHSLFNFTLQFLCTLCRSASFKRITDFYIFL